MSQRFLVPSQAGLRQPTDPKKENGQVMNPPRYPQMGGLDKASRTSASVNGTGNSNPFKVVKPGKGAAR